MALPPPDPTPKKKKPSPRRKTYAKFVDRTAPATKKYNKRPDKMPGPNAPDTKDGNGVLPPRAARSGAYFLPGFGDVARAKNRKRYRDRHAFNPGPGGTKSA